MLISQDFIHAVVDLLVTFATDLLMPFMFFIFFLGIIFRLLIHYTVKRHLWFTKEFDKRIYKHLDVNHIENRERRQRQRNQRESSGEKVTEEQQKQSEQKFLQESPLTTSFYLMTKGLLEKTYYELFIIRGIMKRRNPDYVLGLSDRIFLINFGCAWQIKELLKHIRYLKHNNKNPKFLEITKTIFEQNPAFNRLFGVLPVSMINDVLNILPGLFIIGGIFGTFLGIMKGLPELGQMDLADVEASKQVMDQFLLKISFSMSTSIVGIILSVAQTLLNTIIHPEKVFVVTVERFTNSLTLLWNKSLNNLLPQDIEDFSENKDPILALAEESVLSEIKAHPRYAQDYQAPTEIPRKESETTYGQILETVTRVDPSPLADAAERDGDKVKGDGEKKDTAS